MCLERENCDNKCRVAKAFKKKLAELNHLRVRVNTSAIRSDAHREVQLRIRLRVRCERIPGITSQALGVHNRRRPRRRCALMARCQRRDHATAAATHSPDSATVAARTRQSVLRAHTRDSSAQSHCSAAARSLDSAANHTRSEAELGARSLGAASAHSALGVAGAHE